MIEVQICDYCRRIQTLGGIMKLYQVIVVDENDNLYELDDAWINENFEYDKDYSTITPIKREE